MSERDRADHVPRDRETVAKDARVKGSGSRKVHVTIFADRTGVRLKRRDMTLPELRRMIMDETAPSRERLHWLKLARFGSKRSERRSLRTNENVVAIGGVELDYDGKKISFEAALKIAAEAKLQVLIYTTPSHTDAAPKWRVLAPTSKELDPSERGHLAERINGIYGGVFDPASFTLSQAFLFGKVGDNPAHRAEIVDGDFADLRAELDATAIGKRGEKLDDDDDWFSAWLKGSKRLEADDPQLLAAAIAAIPNEKLDWDYWNRIGMALYGATGGSDEGFRLFDEWSQKCSGYDAKTTADKWKALDGSPPDRIGAGTIIHLADEAAPGWRDAYEAHGRPTILVKAGELDVVANLAEEALRDAGVPLYQRGGALVRPVVAEVDASHGRKTKVAQLVQITPVYLRDVLCRTAIWKKPDARRRTKWARIDPPLEVAYTILQRKGEWRFPVIAGVVSTPTMRPDGSILSTEGYDEATRLLLVAPPPMPPIPDKPTKGDALKALALLKGLLTEFPLVDNVSTAVALSALITPIVRGAFPVAPMHSARAPTPGSGKSYLLDVVAAIAIGQPMPVMAAGRNEEETEKRLGAALLAGQPLISIDNVNGELGGDALCQIIERPLVEIRILGKSERVRIEARGTTTYSSGNNITLVGDLCRRVITSTLDAEMERPETREFKCDPVEAVLADRGAYIAAALTICRAYAVAGRPGRAKRLASFEGWSDCVRSALIWLGEADPVASMETARGDDPELTELREMLSAWAEVFGVGYRHRITLAEVVDIADEETMNYLPAWPRLRSAVRAVVKAGRGPVNAASLGLWMQRRKGRIVGKRRFVSKPGKTSAWWIDGGGEDKDGLWAGVARQGEDD